MQKIKNLLITFITLFTLTISAQNKLKSNYKNAVHTTQIKYLSGTDKDNLVEWDFWISEGRKNGKWTTIGVPSCWEQKGFGNYNYGFDAKNKKKVFEEFGIYKHRFFVDKEWKNKAVKIVFEGVMTDAEVKINGKLAGAIHQGAFYEFKYDITKLLLFGKENTLEVKVHKRSSNASINFAEREADFWIFGGIYRPVYLEILPKNKIDRIAIDAKANGNIKMDAFVDGNKADNIQLTLLNLKGDKIQNLSIDKIEKAKGKFSIESKASNIKTWNAEKPNLYQLKIDLLDKNGSILHTLNQRIGFRTVIVKEADGIYVNNQKIKFKGVNRHSFHPSSGRTTSKKLSIEHVKMIKDMNMNAVRMSHYPPDKHFLQVCDSLGLFVIDEVCTWHSPHLDTKVGRKIVKETVVRDVNHPSILLWANGNETGWNKALDDDYAIWDIQKREVIHPWNIFRKTNTLHYFRYHALASDAYKKDKIFFPTEFLHGLFDGGHGSGLNDYWQKMWNMPLSAGGFLWDFADEAIERTDRNNQLDTDGNHAADGIVGPYGEKEASYFTIKEVWSPIYIEDRYIREHFNGKFHIENRYHFTNLNECKMIAKWIKFKNPDDKENLFVLSESNVKLPELSPLEKGSFLVDKPSNWKEADALNLSVFDVKGMEIFTWSYPIKTPKELAKTIEIDAEKRTIKTIHKDREISILVNKMQYNFSNETGILNKVVKNGKVIPLSNGPIILGHNDKIIDLKIIESEKNTTIKVIFEPKDKTPAWASHVELSSDIIQWTIHKSGILDLHVEMKGKRIVKNYKGITFSFPEEEVKGMKWLGDGPYRVWRNRMKGTRFQVWENDYNNTVTGESGFIYPEFKGFFSSLYWAKIKGKNNNGFTVYCKTPFTFLRMLTPQNPKNDNKDRTSITFPKGDISFLMNIPAMGTKFQDPLTMGPEGNPENYFGNHDDPIVIDLSFKF